MKKILYACFFVFLFSACKKEYKCSNGAVYKDGSWQYAAIKKGQILTDNNGQALRCE